MQADQSQVSAAVAASSEDYVLIAPSDAAHVPQAPAIAPVVPEAPAIAPTLPQAPVPAPAPAPAPASAMILVPADDLQHLLRQFESLKAQLQKLEETPPRDFDLEFVTAVMAKSWKLALALVPKITPKSLNNVCLADIFCRDVEFRQNVSEDRLALWQALLKADLVTPAQLAETFNPGYSKSAFINIIINGNVEMLAWATSKTPPVLLHDFMTHLLGNGQTVIYWIIYYGNVKGLRNLFDLKCSEGKLVFPRTVESAWSWSKFWPEVKGRMISDEAAADCLQFWFEVVKQEFIVQA